MFDAGDRGFQREVGAELLRCGPQGFADLTEALLRIIEATRARLLQPGNLTEDLLEDLADRTAGNAPRRQRDGKVLRRQRPQLAHVGIVEILAHCRAEPLMKNAGESRLPGTCATETP